MTERRPHDVPVETWVDRLVRDAAARGAFDNLPGAGKPLPGIDEPLHEDWWIRQKLRSEDLPLDGLLPPALLLRKELAALPETVRPLRDEAAVRDTVRALNRRVADYIRCPSEPVLPVAPADADAVVAQWRAGRGGDTQTGGTRPAERAAPGRPARRRRWWRLRRARENPTDVPRDGAGPDEE
ncbi:DnaJ family domain-containing protein [Georgenia sp. Marseille-Q6866]